MPRYVVKRKGRLSTQVRADRARFINPLVHKKWIDPFPWVHGTLPEKMVYAELSRRGIKFEFLNNIRFRFKIIKFDKTYQADFIIPSIKTIIEVQGAYWHSKPKTINSDAMKFAIYETGGYRVLAWWDYDIIERLHELFARDAKLSSISKTPVDGRISELPVRSRTKVDTSKGIRTLNRRRGLAKAYKKPAVRMRMK